ncbi:hypothetical protein BsWGS_22487 [Bradybaena similaris]
MSTALDNAKYISLIDAGITNIWSLSLPSHLESLNLHGNNVQNIGNLSHLTRLVHLDLSANQIAVIDGLERLVNLKTLNLSSNLITAADGLSGLRSLEWLNLSYNQIENVSGLAAFSNPSCCLRYLALHGNKLRDLRHVAQSLQKVQTLRNIILNLDGSSNPLCHIPGYVDELWSSLPQLQAVNDLDRQGRLVTDVSGVSSIPGLEACLEFLLLNDKDQVSEAVAKPELVTPKIDAVVELYKQKYAASLDTSSSENGRRMEKVKKTVKEKPSPSLGQQRRMRSRGSSKEHSSGDDSEPVRDMHGKARSKVLHPQNKRQMATKTVGIPYGSEEDKSASEVHSAAPSSAKRQPDGRQQRQRTRFADNEEASRSARVGIDVKSSGDAKGRDEAATFYKDLMKTLETERERRWKAEQAARRLADILKNVQAKGQESEVMKNSALEATVQLKQAVMNEHESNQVLNKEVRVLQNEVRQLREDLDEARRTEERSKEALRAAEASLSSRDAEVLAERMHQKKKLQESQQRASALNRETELLRYSMDAMKLKLQQVQETLASREQQHREEMKNMYRLDSPELQTVIADRLKAAEKSFQADLIKQQEKIEQLSKQYSELEDEFRYALQMEETRLREMKADLERESAENMENKQLLLVAQRKDESCTSMVTELTALVKEQKGRITELARCKQEQAASDKKRIDALEESLENYRKQVSQMELLRQTKSRLQATIQAQESVIEGLKAERKLWGQELAQQGASLSQDRGRLESKIEALNTEIVTLKKQLERETDAVKIKTKIVDDQTETIRKLKEAVIEREEMVKAAREENLAVQRSLEDQQAELKAALDDTRELLDKAMFRKDELKQQVADLHRELKDSKDSHSALSARWKEKSELIGRLEQQVTQMKNNWTQKEVQLVAERDTALKQAKQAIEQLKVADAAFRRQLELKEASFQERITQLEFEKQQEVELANKKVAIVEEEMRDLLQETEANKRAMENKLKKFTQALGDLQSNLI